MRRIPPSHASGDGTLCEVDDVTLTLGEAARSTYPGARPWASRSDRYGQSPAPLEPRAVAAAPPTASALGLRADEAQPILRASNRLTVHLLPSDVVARVAHPDARGAALEVDLTARLSRTRTAHWRLLDPESRRASTSAIGFTITFWTHYESKTARELPPAGYADALSRLHVGHEQVHRCSDAALHSIGCGKLASSSRARERTPETQRR